MADFLPKNFVPIFPVRGMKESMYDMVSEHKICNLKLTFGPNKYEEIIQEISEATTLEDMMKACAKFGLIFGPDNYHEQQYKAVKNKINFKCRKTSETFRTKGNTAFHNEEMSISLRFYTKSIAYAPLDSVELALAYANRSAVLRSMRKCGECLVDIERAFSHGYPTKKSYKLLFRQMLCHRDMGNLMRANISLMKAVKLLQSLSGLTENQKTSMKQQLDGEMQHPGYGVCPEVATFPTEVPELSYGPNPEVVGASSAVRIEYNEQKGRHLVATRDINIGDVLLIAENFCVTLVDRQRRDHCSHCLKPCYNLLPCSNCVWTMFCSEECQTEANEKYHTSECPAYSKFRHTTGSNRYVDPDVFGRVIRLFGMIGINNLQPYLTKYARTNITESNCTDDLNRVFASCNIDTIFDLSSKIKEHSQTDLLISSMSAFLIPLCFSVPLQDSDFFAIAGLYLHLEYIALSNRSHVEYIHFTNPQPIKYIPAISFNPLKSLTNHSCSVGNVINVHYGNNYVFMAKWPVAKGVVLSEDHAIFDPKLPLELRQKLRNSKCTYESKCVTCRDVCREKLEISDPIDQEIAAKIVKYNEHILIDYHRCYVRNVVTSELEKFVKDRRDLLTKLWNKGESRDFHCCLMHVQLAIFQFLQGNRILDSIDYSPQVMQDPESTKEIIEDIKRRNPPKNISEILTFRKTNVSYC